MGLMDNPKVSVDPADNSVNAEYKRTRNKNWVDIIICVAIVIGVLLYKELSSSNQSTIAFTQNQITITTPETEEHKAELYAIVFDQVESAELYPDFETFDKGELISEYEFRNGVCGTYRNAELGEYFLFVTPKYNKYVIVHQPDGVIVFNYESEESTEDACEFLQQMMADREE